ncbi:hypothetical protein GALMADRAFT_258048 [Galerina marginata CBS 339.88]|uniref:Uncharacterized protein n=1 Tax=Galerina marginata (strain CBS 339.88) TaxID=685588 RepID=A0A067SIF9_GALM3|nr:hypothetical protein GALMADRAFT_258048 [Galerina marginata CBS 339.88]
MGEFTGFFSSKGTKKTTSFRPVRSGGVFLERPSHNTDDEDQTQSSPVPHLLKSNYPPSETERKKVEEVLLIARCRFLALQERLDHANAITGTDTTFINPNGKDANIQLNKSISVIRSFLRMHESILSVVRILPTEILSLIFIFCLPHLEPHSWHRRPWKDGPSFRISQVSRRWRQVAHNIPQLWAILGDVSLNPKTAKAGSNLYHTFIQQILHRSGSQDLWIYIHAPFQQYGRSEHPVIDLLLQHVRRWAVVTIESNCMTVNSFSYLDQSQRPIEFPRLRKLAFELWGYPEGFSITGFQSAPALTEVSIRGVFPNLVQVPWNQLKAYREYSFGVETTNGSLDKVLKHSTNLERLAVVGLRFPVAFPPEARNKGLVLKHLKTLHLKLEHRQVNVVKDFVDRLILPSLEELRIGGYPGEVVPVLLSLVLRPKLRDFPLRRLFLRTHTIRTGDLSNLLMHTPRLEELDLHFPLPLQDLRRLIIGGKSQDPTNPSLPLVPLLQRLTIHGKPQDVDETIQAIGRSRFGNENNESSSFRLVFPDRGAALATQSSLNSWEKMDNSHRSSPSSGDDIPTAFVSWRLKLHRELPELQGGPPSKKRAFDMGFPSRLHRLLTEIEEFTLSSKPEVAALWASQLQHSLHSLSNLRGNHIPGEKVYRFFDHAEKILKKWEAPFWAEIPSISWALKGERSLTFIGENDPLRTSAKVLDLVYGFQDDLQLVDIQWPDHM